MDLRSAPRLFALAALVAGVSGAAACGPAKATTASPATSAPTVVESSPPLPSPPPTVPSTSPSSDATSSSACKASAMTVTVYGGDGAAGSAYLGMSLTSKSSTACTVTGFPTLAFLDAAGKAYQAKVDHMTGKATTFTVAPGGKTYFTVRLIHVPSTDPVKAPCDPAAAAMRISLSADGSNPATLKGSWRTCGVAQVSPLTPKPDPNLHD